MHLLLTDPQPKIYMKAIVINTKVCQEYIGAHWFTNLNGLLNILVVRVRQWTRSGRNCVKHTQMRVCTFDRQRVAFISMHGECMRTVVVFEHIHTHIHTLIHLQEPRSLCPLPLQSCTDARTCTSIPNTYIASLPFSDLPVQHCTSRFNFLVR